MHEKAPSRRHYLNVCKVECARWGVDYALTIGGARWRPAVFVRSRVSKHFLALGYGLAATARTMGMHHTTLLHNRRRSDAEEAAYLERGPDGWGVYLHSAPAAGPLRKLTHRFLRERSAASEVITSHGTGDVS